MTFYYCYLFGLYDVIISFSIAFLEYKIANNFHFELQSSLENLNPLTILIGKIGTIFFFGKALLVIVPLIKWHFCVATVQYVYI